MNDYVERYIHDVIRRLPDAMRKDASERLRRIIEDKQKTHALETVLKELGTPRMVATELKNAKTYVVDPMFYDDYVHVLRIVFFMLISVGLVMGLMETFFDATPRTSALLVIRLIERVFSHMLVGAMAAFSLTTLFYWFLSRYATQPRVLSDWTLDDLPEIPRNLTLKIDTPSTRIEWILSMTMGLIGIIILIRYADVIGFYDERGLIAPIFNPQVIQTFIPFFMIALGFHGMVGVMKRLNTSWNIGLGLFHTATILLFVSVFVLFIHQPTLILFDAYFTYARLHNVPIMTLQRRVEDGIMMVTYIVAGLALMDLIFVWYRLLKKGDARLNTKTE